MPEQPRTAPLICLLLALLLPAASRAQTCDAAHLPATTPTAQFTDHNDGTVTDTKTGLMWKKCSEGQSGADCSGGSAASYTWQAALQQAQTVNNSGFATYTDWRVPNIKELRSITERQCTDPTINLAVFPATPSNYYWSSSSVAGHGYYAWYVTTSNGYDNGNYKYNDYQVRLVRGGQ